MIKSVLLGCFLLVSDEASRKDKGGGGFGCIRLLMAFQTKGMIALFSCCCCCGHLTYIKSKDKCELSTDMYYATWGFFPIGFANPGSTDWRPFVTLYPGGGGGGDGVGPYQKQPQANGPGSSSGGGSAEQSGRNKKKTARKKVMGRPTGRMFGNQVNFGDADDDNVADKEEEARGININEAAKGIGEENIDMMIDLDTTDDMLGNLQNLPFLKDDGINLHSGGF